MEVQGEIGLYSAIWIFVFAVTLISTFRRRLVVGLTATFLITFWANHWLGSVMYVLPGPTVFPPIVTAAGLQQSLWGMVAFAFGSLVLTPIVTHSLANEATGPPPVQPIVPDLPRRIRLYLLVGMMAYFVPFFAPVLLRIPTFSTAVQALTSFTVLAAYLFVFMKMRDDSRNTWWYVVLMAGLFPLVGIISAGFASFGSVVSVLLITFYFSYNRASSYLSAGYWRCHAGNHIRPV